MTTFVIYQERLHALLQLIRLQSTGSARELSAKFNISERTVKRMIDTLRQQGYKITYQRSIGSYILEN